MTRLSLRSRKTWTRRARPAFGMLCAWTLVGSLPSALATDIGVIGQFGGYTMTVRVYGDYAYIGEGPNLTILDVSDAASPRHVGKIFLDDRVRDVIVRDRVAYVAAGHAGVQTVDIADLGRPRRSNQYATDGRCNALYLEGATLYVAAGEDGLLILDVSLPHEAQLLGEADTSGYTYDVVVAGAFAYLADHDEGMKIFDVSDPTSPVLAAVHPTPDKARAVEVVDTIAYVAATSSLRVVDVSDPTTPSILAAYGAANMEARDLAIDGAKLFLPNGFRGIMVLDILDPLNISVVQAADTPGYAFSTVYANGYIHVADGWEGYRIIGRGTYTPASRARHLAIDGGIAVVANNEAETLTIIDVSDPRAPFLLGATDVPESPYKVALGDGIACIAADNNSLFVADISDPTSPAIRCRVEVGGVVNVALVGDYLYTISSGLAGLKVFDVSQPFAPALLTTHPSIGLLCYDLVVEGHYLFIPTNMSMYVFDISVPAAPSLCFHRCVYPYPEDMSIEGSLAYCTSFDGMTILDVSDPTSPTQFSTWNNPYGKGYANDIAVTNGMAYLTCGHLDPQVDVEKEVLVVDVSDPKSPGLLTGFDLPAKSSAWCVVAVDGVCYVANDYGGVWVFGRTTPPSAGIAASRWARYR